MKRVCVTGAGGYIASWVVKLFLSKGYVVHGTVRNPCDEKKNGHLKKLESGDERLKHFTADLFDYEALCAAFDGCTGVLHIASPILGRYVPNPKVELLDPAILGTQNVLNACLKAKVEKIVIVSSAAAVFLNPKCPSGEEMDESCWADVEYAKSIEKWYIVAKTLAEGEALEFAKRDDLKFVKICPTMVIGPMLQSTVNATSLLLLTHMREDGRTGGMTIANIDRSNVDVCDLSEAILLLYENPKAEGRYLCSAYSSTSKELNAILESKFTGYNYPKMPLEETIVDTVKIYDGAGLLDEGKPLPFKIEF